MERRSTWKRWVLYITIGIIISMIVLVGCDDSTEPEDTGVENEDSLVSEESGTKDTDKDISEPEKSVDSSNVAEDKKAEETKKDTKEDIPKEYESALKKAQIYANSMHMSKQGVYEQLVFIL